MANYPKPKGWKGGPDGSIVRTLDGRLGINENSDSGFAADLSARRNERSFDEADLGGDYS